MHLGIIKITYNRTALHFMDDRFVNLREGVILTLQWQSDASESATVCFVISLSICYWLFKCGVLLVVCVCERERARERERETAIDVMFTGGSVIMAYELVFETEVKLKLLWWICFLQTQSFCIHKMLTDWLESCGLIVVFKTSIEKLKRYIKQALREER